MKLITFIGIGDYESVIYQWGEHTKETRFFAEALVEWFEPEMVCVILTPMAKQGDNWRNLKPLLENMTTIQEIDIPSGKNEQELWEIFQKITEAVADKDELVFDITHSFRSLPMLSLLAIAYLKQVKSVQIQHLLYGAYEAREGNVAPVFDLTPFAELLDWLTAVKMFIATGNANEMAGLLENIKRRARKEAPNLDKLATAMRVVSNSLLLSRVPILSKSVGTLQKRLDAVRTTGEVEQWAIPMTSLLNQMTETYHPFARDDLHTQAKLIDWYYEHGHIVQAATLAREWVISYNLQRQGKDWRDMRERKAMECMLNTEAIKDPLWSKVSYLRNDLAHCGFGRAEGQVLSVDSIRDQMRDIIDAIHEYLNGKPE